MDNKNEIEVIIYNKETNLNQVESKKIGIKNKVIYYNEEYDVTIIEIDEKRDGKYVYLELDENILNKNKINEYLGNSIYILQYPCYYEKQKLAVSYGIIKNRFIDREYDFQHYCSTEYGSSGSPILNIYNNKVIGIHKQREVINNYNIGSFLYYSIKEFIYKYKDKYAKEYLKEFNKEYNLNIKNINITQLDLSKKNLGNNLLKFFYEKLTFKELKKLNLYSNNISDIKLLENIKFEKIETLS